MRLVRVIKTALIPIGAVVHRIKAVSDAEKGKGRQGNSDQGEVFLEQQTLVAYANLVRAPKCPAGDLAAGSIATQLVPSSTTTTALYGEIPIKKELLPSSNFLILSVEVCDQYVCLMF